MCQNCGKPRGRQLLYCGIRRKKRNACHHHPPPPHFFDGNLAINFKHWPPAKHTTQVWKFLVTSCARLQPCLAVTRLGHGTPGARLQPWRLPGLGTAPPGVSGCAVTALAVTRLGCAVTALAVTSFGHDTRGVNF